MVFVVNCHFQSEINKLRTSSQYAKKRVRDRKSTVPAHQVHVLKAEGYPMLSMNICKQLFSTATQQKVLTAGATPERRKKRKGAAKLDDDNDSNAFDTDDDRQALTSDEGLDMLFDCRKQRVDAAAAAATANASPSVPSSHVRDDEFSNER